MVQLPTYQTTLRYHNIPALLERHGQKEATREAETEPDREEPEQEAQQKHYSRNVSESESDEEDEDEDEDEDETANAATEVAMDTDKTADTPTTGGETADLNVGLVTELPGPGGVDSTPSITPRRVSQEGGQDQTPVQSVEQLPVAQSSVAPPTKILSQTTDSKQEADENETKPAKKAEGRRTSKLSKSKLLGDASKR